MNPVVDLLGKLRERGIRLALENDTDLRVRGDKDALDAALVAAIRSAKQDIIAYLRASQAGQGGGAIAPAPRTGPMPASYGQQRLWLLDQIDGGVHYNMPGMLRLSGALNHGALEHALGAVLARHESLRTSFAAAPDGQPLQVIHPATPVTVALTDLTALPPGEQRARMLQLAADEAAARFDLACAHR
jgi:hypothetical protein